MPVGVREQLQPSVQVVLLGCVDYTDLPYIIPRRGAVGQPDPCLTVQPLCTNAMRPAQGPTRNRAPDLQELRPENVQLAINCAKTTRFRLSGRVGPERVEGPTRSRTAAIRQAGSVSSGATRSRACHTARPSARPSTAGQTAYLGSPVNRLSGLVAQVTR